MSKSARWIMAAVLCAALIIALALHWMPPGKPAPATQASRQSDSIVSTGAIVSSKTVDAAHDVVSRPAGAQTNDAPTTQSEANGVGASLPPAPPRRGFFGRVTNKLGKPLPGVSIRFGSYANLEKAPISIATTDADGRYALDSGSASFSTLMVADKSRDPSAFAAMDLFSEGQMALAAVPTDSYAPAWKAPVAPGTAEHPSEINFELDAGGSLEIVVVDADAKPLSGIAITIGAPAGDPYARRLLPGSGAKSFSTDAQGRVRIDHLPPPSVSVSAEGWGYAPVSHPSAPLNKPLALTMQPAGVLLGRAVDAETDMPIADFRVFIGGEGVQPERGQIAEVFSDAGGRFHLDSLVQNAAYHVRVAAQDYCDASLNPLKASPVATAEETIFRLSKGAMIAVETYDAATGLPVPGQTVFLAQLNAEGQSEMDPSRHIALWNEIDRSPNRFLFQRVESQTSDAAGRVAFREGAVMGALLIRGGKYRRTVVEAGEREKYKTAEGVYRIPLNEGIAISGIYTSADGAPLPHRRVWLRLGKRDFMQEDFEPVETDAQGKYVFAGLRADTATLWGYGEDFDDLVYFRCIKRIAIGSEAAQTINLGDRMGRFRLNGKITLDGKPAAHAPVWIRNQSGWEYEDLQTRADASGAYEIAGLMPGRYEFMSPVRKSKESTIVIDGDMRKDFDLSAGHEISGRLVFPEGMDADERARYVGCDLVRPDGNPADNDDGSDAFIHLKMDGDRVSGRGRAKGTYAVNFQYEDLRNRGEMRKSEKLFEIDNEPRDRDIGDIPVPRRSGIAFRLVFARTEDEKLFHYLQIAPRGANGPAMDDAQEDIFDHITVQPNEEVFLSGNFQGEYGFEFMHEIPDGMSTQVPIPGHVNIDNPAIVTNLGDIIVYPIYRVRGRFVFDDPEHQKLYRSAMIEMRNTRQQNEENGFADISLSGIDAQGRFEFPGLFMSMGRITLWNGSDSAINLKLPDKFNLSNAEGDQDLGDIHVGTAPPAPAPTPPTTPASIAAP